MIHFLSGVCFAPLTPNTIFLHQKCKKSSLVCFCEIMAPNDRELHTATVRKVRSSSP